MFVFVWFSSYQFVGRGMRVSSYPIKHLPSINYIKMSNQIRSAVSRYLFVYGNSFHFPMHLLSSNPSPVSRLRVFKNWFFFCFYMCPGPQYSLFFTQFTYTIIRNHCMPVKCIRLISAARNVPFRAATNRSLCDRQIPCLDESANAARLFGHITSLLPYFRTIFHFVVRPYNNWVALAQQQTRRPTIERGEHTISVQILRDCIKKRARVR